MSDGGFCHYCRKAICVCQPLVNELRKRILGDTPKPLKKKKSKEQGDNQ